MKKIKQEELERIIRDILAAVGLNEANIHTVARIYLEKTVRGSGHHDINDFAERIDAIRAGRIKKNPEFVPLSSYGCMESWDGGCGLGELTCTFAMDRAIHLAKLNGIGFCAMRNSNHYLASSLYTIQATKAGCIGIIIAKAGPNMGVPGYQGNVISQTPNGFAFSTGKDWPIVLDGCLAYVSGHGNLNQYIKEGKSVPSWWGVGPDGESTTDPAQLLRGTRYPIGEHKGFGYAILGELLTGVMGQGLILDQAEGADGLRNVTTHTAIAIKADALMNMDQYKNRSTELIDRIEARAPGIRIPGRHSYDIESGHKQNNDIEINDNVFDKLNKYAVEFGIEKLNKE